MRTRLSAVMFLAGVLLLFLILGAGYVWFVPLWETPDEPSNVSTALVTAKVHRVPTALEQPLYPGVTLNAKHHPPLYFVIMGLMFATKPSLEPRIVGSPFGGISAEVPRYQHDGGTPADRFPGAGFLRGVRGLSVVLGAATLFVVWHTARLLMPNAVLGPALGTAVLGLTPTFLFSHAAIDPLPFAALVASLIIWHMVGVFLRGVPTGANLRTLGLLLVIGLMVRASLAFLYIPAAYLVWRERGRRLHLAGHIATPAAIGLVWMLVLSPGPSMQAFRHLGAQLLRLDRSLLSLGGFRTLLLHTKNSFWARFGWADLYAPARLIDVFDGLSLVMAAGWLLILIRRARPRGAAFLAGCALVGVMGYVKGNLAQFDPQGRYLGLLIAAYAPLCGLGLSESLRLIRSKLLRRMAVGAIIGLVVGANLYSLGAVIRPAYAARLYEHMAVDVYQEQGTLVWGGAAAGQTFVARRPGLTRVELYFTPARHTPRRILEFRLLESPLIPEPIAVARIPYPTPRDRPQTGFTFVPQWDSEGRSYYVRVTLAPQGDPVSAWYTLEDRYTGGSRYADETPVRGDLRFTAYYALPRPGGPGPEPAPPRGL